MRFLKLTLAYDGTGFAGWQFQPDRRTVQQTLERAIEKVTGQRVRVRAAGRTDAGVHALGQVASVALDSHLTAQILGRALNANMPDDLIVLEVSEAPPGFHANRDATGKRYRYLIQDGPIRDLFSRAYAWHIPQRLDAAAMQQAAHALIGTHDFRSFQASGSPRASSVRTITDLRVTRYSDGGFEKIAIEVAADGFLYNMVRGIVGTLVKVGRGREPIEWPGQVLAARDRKLAGMTAPPHGLFLVRVDYDPPTIPKKSIS